LAMASSWPDWQNPDIVLYHGTLAKDAGNIQQNGVDLSHCRPDKDFGRGFYTTTLLAQAVAFADTKSANNTGSSAAVIKFTVNRIALAKLKSLAFIRGTVDPASPANNAIDYWSFVAHCRRGDRSHPVTDEDYDVVYGPVARTWFGPARSRTEPGWDQISFHTKAAASILNQSQYEVLT